MSIKAFILSAIVLVLSFASCKKEDVKPVDIPISSMSIKATINNDSTGTCRIDWKENDAIAIINNGKLYKFVAIKDSMNNSSASFAMDMSSLPPEYIEGDFNPEMPMQAFYPYEGVTYDPYTRTIEYSVPGKQSNQKFTDKAGSADQNAGHELMPMAAYAENVREELVFQKLFWVFNFSITGADDEYIKGIEIISSTNINGKALVTIEKEYANSPDISIIIYQDQEEIEGETDVEKDYKRIILDCSNNSESLASKADYYVTLPVNTKNLGILINTSVTSYYRTITDLAEIVPGAFLSLEEPVNTTELTPAYIDNGVYLGNGIKLPKTLDGSEYIIWAPVNCGYEAPVLDGSVFVNRGYPYGKLYQWGRKDGHGYKDNIYEDATYPYEVSSIAGKQPEQDKFYWDWALGAEEWPADSDPCPTGWRVPTSEEILSLVQGLSQNDYMSGLDLHWTYSNENAANGHFGMPGFWFWGNVGEAGEKAFFPAGGIYKNDTSGCQIRGLSGCYWSSTGNGTGAAWYMDFNRKGYIDTYFDNHACGRSVRCVKDLK